MTKLTQTTRHIAIDTPLGEDVLLLQRFSAHEEMSCLFTFDLDLLSKDYEIDFEDIIGQNVTISMELPGGGKRYWNGFINRFEQVVSTRRKFAQYEATMVPWLWFLTLTSDCRIFQEKTVPDIVKKVFKDLGFSDIEDRLSPGYRIWNYCVQYRETHFNFVSRLMEQEGIYYYFLHEKGKCTIVLCDSLSKHDKYGDYGEIKYIPDTSHSSLQERISDWAIQKQVLPGKFAHTDYNFEKPSTSLMSTDKDQKSHARGKYEIYDFPGEYPEKADGDRYAKVRMEELAYAHELCTGQSDSRGLCSGYKFKLSNHPRADQNREYLIRSTDYQAAAGNYETSGGQGEMCACFFTVIPGNVQYRPERKTPKPVIQGTQTAVVTGPSGEEIYPDKYGRIKVQFHWDREGQYDENSSCWIRVSQVHAGKGFGGIDIPRIGEEVIVSFMGGDPDQPLITGRVYNAELMPPFELPGQKVVSGMKSNSTPGGGGYNEISLNDTKGKENITIHGQYDMNTTVEHDQTLVVHNNRTDTIDVDDSETVKGNQTLSVKGNRAETVNGTENVTIDGATTHTINAAYTRKVASNYTLSADSNIKSTAKTNWDGIAGAKLTLDAQEIKLVAGSKIEIVCGGSSIVLEPAKITISSGSGNIDVHAPGVDIMGGKIQLN